MTRQFDDFELDTWQLSLSRFEIRDVQTAMRQFVTEANQDQARRVVLGDIVALTRFAREERKRAEPKPKQLPVCTPQEAAANRAWLERMFLWMAKRRRTTPLADDSVPENLSQAIDFLHDAWLVAEPGSAREIIEKAEAECEEIEGQRRQAAIAELKAKAEAERSV